MSTPPEKMRSYLGATPKGKKAAKAKAPRLSSTAARFTTTPGAAPTPAPTPAPPGTVNYTPPSTPVRGPQYTTSPGVAPPKPAGLDFNPKPPAGRVITPQEATQNLIRAGLRDASGAINRQQLVPAKASEGAVTPGADRYAAGKIKPNAPRFLRGGPVGAGLSLAAHAVPTAEPISDQTDPTQSQQYRDAAATVQRFRQAGFNDPTAKRLGADDRGGVLAKQYRDAAALVGASEQKRGADAPAGAPNQPAIPDDYAPNILDQARGKATDFIERLNTVPTGDQGVSAKQRLTNIGDKTSALFERLSSNPNTQVGDRVGLSRLPQRAPTDSNVGAGSDAGVTTAPAGTPGTPGTPGARPAPERIASGFGTQSGQPGVPGIVREGNSYSASGPGTVTGASPFLNPDGSTRQGGSFSVVSGPSDEQRARTANAVAGINSQIAALRDLREARNPGITTRQFGGQDATPTQDFSAVDKLLKAADNAPSRVKREALLEQARLVQDRISGQGELAQRGRQADQANAASRFSTETQAATQRERTALDRAELSQQTEQDRLAAEQDTREQRLEEEKFLQTERKNAADAAYKRTKQRGDEFKQLDSVLGDMGLNRGIFFQFIQNAGGAIKEMFPEKTAKAIVSGNGSIADYNQLLPLVAQHQKSNPGFFARYFGDPITPGDRVRNTFADQ